MNIFIIRLALSYINALELKNYLSLESSKCVLLLLYQTKNEVDLKHIELIMDKSQWRAVHYLPYNFEAFQKKHPRYANLGRMRGRISARNAFVDSYNSVLSLYSRCERVIIGNELTTSARHVCHMMKPSEVINIDEGFKTYTALMDRNRRSLMEKTKAYSEQWMKAAIIYVLSGYKIWPLNHVTYFTSYGLDSSVSNTIWLNTFQSIRTELKGKKRKRQVLFLGQSLCELSFVEEEVYIKVLKDIKEYFSEFEFIYQPHRDESADKLQKLRVGAGIDNIKTVTMPIELKILMDDFLPVTVASFFSSALQNLNHIFDDQINVMSFYLSRNLFIASDAKKDEIEGFYNYLRQQKKTGIEIVELTYSNH